MCINKSAYGWYLILVCNVLNEAHTGILTVCIVEAKNLQGSWCHDIHPKLLAKAQKSLFKLFKEKSSLGKELNFQLIKNLFIYYIGPIGG